MLEQLVWIIGITGLCMISPGPDMALVVRNTLLASRAEGLATSLGILLGNLIHISYCAFGLGLVIARSVVVYSAVRYAGAVYLIVLGIQSLRSRARSDGADAMLPERASSRAPRVRAPFVQGLFNNLLNPKGALFYMGVFTQVITPATPWPQTAVLIAAMVATSALFWLLFVLTIEQPWMRNLLERSRRTVERVFGVILIGLGLRVAVQD